MIQKCIFSYIWLFNENRSWPYCKPSCYAFVHDRNILNKIYLGFNCQFCHFRPALSGLQNPHLRKLKLSSKSPPIAPPFQSFLIHFLFILKCTSSLCWKWLLNDELFYSFRGKVVKVLLFNTTGERKPESLLEYLVVSLWNETLNSSYCELCVLFHCRIDQYRTDNECKILVLQPCGFDAAVFCPNIATLTPGQRKAGNLILFLISSNFWSFESQIWDDNRFLSVFVIKPQMLQSTLFSCLLWGHWNNIGLEVPGWLSHTALFLSPG